MLRDRLSRLASSSRRRPLALLALVALLLSVCLTPATAKPLRGPAPAPASSLKGEPLALPADSPSGPVRVSVLDLLGKIGLAILLVYALAFVLTRTKGLRALGRWLPTPTRADNRRLRLSESLPLGAREGTLHLVEVDGQVMLVWACGEQLQVLWSPASDTTSSFKPVTEEVAEPLLPVAQAHLSAVEKPLFQRGFGKLPRRESDWARERSRLISALMESE